MDKNLTGLLLFVSVLTHAQPAAEKYFQKIRNNTAQLTAFMSQMPKGGDLHHHSGGSLYAEPLLDRAIKEDFYLNTQTMAVTKEKGMGNDWIKFSELEKQGLLENYRIKILSHWSIKDYYPGLHPSDKLFFESFDKFWPAVEGHFAEGLMETKNRAIKDNVSYIETQLSPVHFTIESKDLNGYNNSLRQLAFNRNEKEVMQLLGTIYDSILNRGAVVQAIAFNKNFVEKLHDSLKIDDERFTMRYQNFVFRFMPPVDLFKSLVMSFISAEKSDLIAGVNIVAPEDGEVSMRDYWLHMLMFKFCHQKYPAVKYTMHAGELTMGLVQPEELTWHINAAVHTAGAKRIGHGVDMAYEENCYDLLRYMSKNKIAVEINLASNEFILKVKDDRHPLELYQSFAVPIVISTDDMAILRTSHTEQFVLLAKRYPSISYQQIKKFVFNSIEYSFIKEESVKNKLKADLEQRFKKFEASLPQ